MKRKVKVGIIVILLFLGIGVILDISTPAFEDVLPSDKILIKKDGEVFWEIDDPSLLIEEGFGTGYYDSGQLGLNRFRMKTKYEIAFLKEDKVLAKYKILTPKTEKAIAKVKTNGGWFTMNDDYVVLYDDFTYFSFGYPFFDRLGEIIAADK